jgi:hypothetical protein
MARRPVLRLSVIVVSMLVATAAYGSATTESGSRPYAPRIDPADFGGPIDNPYSPIVPGTRWVYEGDAGE